MRRHLLLALSAVLFAFASATPASAQPDEAEQPSYYGTHDRYNDGRYDPYAAPPPPPYGAPAYGTPYVRPYPQPYPPPPGPNYRYDQRAQRFGGLQIIEAWYGRGRRVCDAAHTMRNACEGQGGCTVKAGNELCGDPVPGVVKGLSVTYSCHGQVRRADQQEPGHIGLRC